MQVPKAKGYQMALLELGRYSTTAKVLLGAALSLFGYGCATQPGQAPDQEKVLPDVPKKNLQSPIEFRKPFRNVPEVHAAFEELENGKGKTWADTKKFKKRGYLDYAFLEWASEIGEIDGAKYWNAGNKPVEWVYTLFRQFCASLNDVPELVGDAVFGTLDGAGYNLSGARARGEINKEYLKNFWKYFMNRMPAGPGNDEFAKLISKGKLKEAMDYSALIESTQAGAAGGTVLDGLGLAAGVDSALGAIKGYSPGYADIFPEGTFMHEILNGNTSKEIVITGQKKNQGAPF